MAMYKVFGNTSVMVETIVEADSVEEAMEKAYKKCSTLDYCEGDTPVHARKTIGVKEDGVKIDPSNDIQYTDAEPLDANIKFL